MSPKPPEQGELLTTVDFLVRHSVTLREPGKLYLRLFHGRSDRAQDLDDWGLEGPVLGPVQWMHVTYTSNIKIKFEDGAEYLCLTEEDPLCLVGDLLFCDGVYYGDFILFVEP